MQRSEQTYFEINYEISYANKCYYLINCLSTMNLSCLYDCSNDFIETDYNCFFDATTYI